MVPKIGLVLEGGGMRTIFTAGVLDYCSDNGIVFPYISSVSGGSCCALCYMSHQRGRAKSSMIDLQKHIQYLSLQPKNIVKQKVFDFDVLFQDNQWVVPFDYEACFHTPIDFEIGTSNCLTGEANYFCERESPQRLVDICRASSSIPVVMKTSYVDGVPMLDGGISDPIPYDRSVSKGYVHNVVVLTRPIGHVSHYTHLPIPTFIYHKYPKIKANMVDRGKRYNVILRRLEKLEKNDDGSVLVLRPSKPMRVTAVSSNTKKLEALYAEGYEAGKKIVDYIARLSE